MNEPTPISTTEDHRFFGYFDKCPWSFDENQLLTHEVNFNSRPPKPGDVADIVVVDVDSGSRTKLAESTAWNFQMGTMLQWIGPDFDDEIIYNDRKGDDLVSRIASIRSEGNCRTIDDPIYCLLPDGSTAYSLDFRRLQELRPGYGYLFTSNKESSIDSIPSDNGLFKINLKENQTTLILSFKDLAELNPVGTMSDGPHWINHIQISPTGNYVGFLHRWKLADGGMYTRLCTCKPDGSELRVSIDSGRVTHYAWQTDDSILAWAREQPVLRHAAKEGDFNRPLIRPVIKSARNLLSKITVPDWFIQDVLGEGFFIYQRVPGKDPKPMDFHNRDGHPNFSPDGRWLVFDTYPTSKGERELYLVDIASGKKEKIGGFHSPHELNNTVYRCDLHPRWNRSGTEICFDSAHAGKREVYTLDVTTLIDM